MIFFVLVPVLCCMTTHTSVQASPATPNVSPSAGLMLVALARDSMLNYLANRTDVGAQPIPAKLRKCTVRVEGKNKKNIPISQAEYPVSITLRHRGKAVARSLQRGRGLARNVIAAAMTAMRSPSLPNRVDAELIRSLTIEMEILGPDQPVARADIAKVVVPGRWGLKLSVGRPSPSLRGPHLQRAHQESYVLPSTAYTLGWDAERMRKQCLSGLYLSPESRGLKRTWSTFATLHFVGYPGRGGTWLLYRGKNLALAEAEDRLGAPLEIAGFLLRSQQLGGQLRLPDGPTTTVEQLYAAATLAELAGRSKPEQAKKLYAVANAVLGHVAKNFVKLDEAAGLAHVVTIDAKDEIPATAMFALACSSLPDFGELSRAADPKARQYQQMMLNWLRDRIDADGRFGQSGLLASAIALTALYRCGEKGDGKFLSMALERLAADVDELGVAADPAAADPAARPDTLQIAWAGRAILAAGGGPEKRLMYFVRKFCRQLLDRQAIKGALADERGAIRNRDGRLTTAGTAAAVVMFSQALQRMGAAADPKLRKRMAEAIPAGQNFCRKMMYHQVEVFFAGKPAEWTGAVRRRPASAEISLTASAAAIEALLADK